jgi:hypothetical protein
MNMECPSNWFWHLYKCLLVRGVPKKSGRGPMCLAPNYINYHNQSCHAIQNIIDLHIIQRGSINSQTGGRGGQSAAYIPVAIATSSLTSCTPPPCFNVLLSSTRPGTTPTVAMYRNPPATKGTTHSAAVTVVPKMPVARPCKLATSSSAGETADATEPPPDRSATSWIEIPIKVPVSHEISVPSAARQKGGRRIRYPGTPRRMSGTASPWPWFC